MLLPKLGSKLMGCFADFLELTIDVGTNISLVVGHDANLRIPFALHTTIIDVCATDDNNLIVHDHQLRVDVDYLGAWLGLL